MCREVHQPESLHELIDIDAAVLVEVDALGQVHYGLVTDVHLKMRAEEFPGLTKLLKGDQTWKNHRSGGWSSMRSKKSRFLLCVFYKIETL